MMMQNNESIDSDEVLIMQNEEVIVAAVQYNEIPVDQLQEIFKRKL